MRETATFLEIYNREAALIGLLRDEKASLMAEREQLVEALKRGEEKHKVALRLLCQDKDNVAKELQEKIKKRERLGLRTMIDTIRLLLFCCF